MGIWRVLRFIRQSQSGNVFFALFGAVALVGVVGASSMQIMKGPVRSMSEVTKRTVAENNMIASAKLALIAATSGATGGDCDNDGFVEPTPFESAGGAASPLGGGFMPSSIGAALNDPWDTRYGYCVWDHGAVTTGCTGQNYLAGENGATGYAIAIISAGPDRQFQTACSAYPTVTALNKTPGTDDIVLGYTYGEASALSGGLWELKDGDAETAEIQRNLEVKDSGGNTTFALDADTGMGDFIGIMTGSIAGKSGPLDITGGLKFEDTGIANGGACTEDDSFAYDGTLESLVRCNGAIWVPAGGSDNLGNHEATENIQLGTHWLTGDATGNDGIQINAAGAVTTSGSVAVGGDLTTSGFATIGTTLGVTGATSLSTLSTSGLATLNTATVTGAAGVGGTLNVTGGTTLTSLTGTGAASLDSLAVTNAATIGSTLGVTGATSLTTLTTTGLAIVESLGVTNNVAIGGNLDLTGGRISNLLDPVSVQDAATKAYVDARVASGSGFVEQDPQVGVIQTGKWCIGNNDGTAIVCDQNMPVPTDTLAGLSCTNGQIPKYNGTAWVCAADGGGSGAVEYLHVNGFQTNSTIGSRVPFSSAISALGTSATLNTTNGIITLQPGKTYRLSGQVRINTSSASSSGWDGQWFNITSGAFFGNPFAVASWDNTEEWSDLSLAVAYLTPSVVTQVEFQSTYTNSGTDIEGHAWIEVLGGGGSGGAGDGDTLADLSCTNGQIPKYNGTVWACAADGGGGGPEVKFSVAKSANQTGVTSGVNTLVTWNTEVFDTNNNFASNRFTPTVPGKYLISLAVACSSSNNCQALIYKNGANVGRGIDTDSNSITRFANATLILDMNGTTDYVEAYGFTAGSTFISGDSFFSGALLSSGGGGSGTDTLAGLSCTSGQVAAWDGDSWECTTVSSGGGGGSGGGGTYIHVANRQASGTSGHTVTAGSWQTLVLNTEMGNTLTGASLAANQVTLPAGTYRAKFTVPVYALGAGSVTSEKNYALRLWNVTANTTAVDSTSGYTGQRNNDTERLNLELSGDGYFTLSAPSTLNMQMYTSNDLNVGNRSGVPGRQEYFTSLIIEEIGGSGGGDNLGDHIATQSVRLYKTTGPAGDVVPGVGDNLGNHTATTDLNLATNDILNGGTITATSFVGDGSLLTGVSGSDNLGNHNATQRVRFFGAAGSPGGLAPGLESDPQVGTLTNTKWCRSDGTQVICDQDAPSGAPSGTLCGSRRASCGSISSSPTTLSHSGDSVLCAGTTIAAGSCNTSRVPQTISCPAGYTGQKMLIQTRTYNVSFNEYITSDWHMFCSKD